MQKHSTLCFPSSTLAFSRIAVGIAVATSAISFNAMAESAENTAKKRPEVIVVVGDQAADILRQPGSVALVTPADLEIHQPRSTEEALRNVPGVAVKPEEESAVVANIGVRGLSSADYKTLILEDGVPVAPGLFVGNGRYYNPRIQRMEAIEVLKGAASLRFGPSTIGGVINYITKQPEDGVQVFARAGSFNTQSVTLEVGGSNESKDAYFGAQISHDKSDGFMDKDYDMTDVMVKAGLDINNDQSVSVKYTDYKNDANISYRGLFLNAYENGERYNPAPDDYFLTGRRSLDITHEWDINADTTLSTLVYGSKMYRDYWRFGTDNAASMDAGRWIYTDKLNGNNRAFERFGVDSRLQLEHSLFGLKSESQIGLRYMYESMDDQTIGATRETPRTGTLNKDVTDSAKSSALYLQNRFELNEQLAVTAGLRVEHYEQTRNDKRKAQQVQTSNTEVLPGLGITYQVTPDLQAFGSVYKAFSPALNGDALNGLDDQELAAERSVNFEAGLRGQSQQIKYELTYFRMDFDNQIIPANSNSQFQRTNGGETLHQGVEGQINWQLNSAFNFTANATYVPDAEFEGARFNANGDVTTPDGNRVTYTPEWIANMSLEHRYNKLRTSLSVHYTGDQFTDVKNTVEIKEATSGFFTGQIDAYTLLNLNAVYEVSSALTLSASVKNLADKEYIASLRQGIYVGTERSFDVGVRYKF